MTEANQSIHVVIGMPGSGKTTYLKRLLADGMIDCYFDDYQKGTPEEDKSNPRLSPNYPALTLAVQAGKNVAVADILYCLPEKEALMADMLQADFPETALVYTYFANNPDACRYNVRLRNREEHLDTELQHIDLMSVQYDPPQNQTIPVIMG